MLLKRRPKTYPNALMHDFGDGAGSVPAHKHPNGMGIVANTAKVGPLVFVGEDALVYGEARVTGLTRVCHRSRVCGRAKVGHNVHVEHDARVEGDARVQDHTWVIDSAVVRGQARVYEEATIAGDTVVEGDQEVGGSTNLEDLNEGPSEAPSFNEDEDDSEDVSGAPRQPTRIDGLSPVDF